MTIIPTQEKENMNKELFELRKKTIEELVKDKNYVPMKFKEMAMLLNVSKGERDALKEILDSLVKEGRISLSGKGKYAKPDMSSIVGKFISHQRGFGFVEIEGEEEDVFIPEENVGDAMHNDTVQIVITVQKSGDKRREGKVVKVLERGTNNIVGVYEKSKNYGFVIPDNQRFTHDIFIASGNSMGAVDGHKVVVNLTYYGDEKRNPEGKIVKILGHINDPGTDIMSVVEAYEIPNEFPEDVMSFLDKIPEEVKPEDYEGRKDIRDWKTVTIDGEDAKDLDDAITISREGDMYRLGVHIADVTNYVTEGNPLDKEALKRGTSVYLVDRVIPMLPHKLSNGICSLNHDVDRLALSCIMDIDAKGVIKSHEICETVVNVDRRMSYTSVKKILDNDPEECAKYEGFVDMFKLMEELAAILRENRRKRGSIDFDFPECKIKLDEKGKPIEIKPYERNTATKIIEDFMLAANETVAEDYFWQEIPFVYRTHDVPATDKIQALGAFINNFGYSIRIRSDEVRPIELQKLLTKIEDTPEEALISRLTLRSMKRAEYSTECIGHFGLAAKYYTHFTSPIRRYPDLQIHRIIKENLHGKMTDKRENHYASILPEVAKQASKTERRADDAERDTEKMKKVEYMSTRIGQVFEGVISGVTAWGFYVELPDTIEGMVHMTALKDDYYIYDEQRYELVGEVKKKTYKLGQKIKVRLVSTDKLQRIIDFEVYEEGESDEQGE